MSRSFFADSGVSEHPGNAGCRVQRAVWGSLGGEGIRASPKPGMCQVPLLLRTFYISSDPSVDSLGNVSLCPETHRSFCPETRCSFRSRGSWSRNGLDLLVPCTCFMEEKSESRDVEWPTLTHSGELRPGRELCSLPSNPGLWRWTDFVQGKRSLLPQPAPGAGLGTQVAGGGASGASVPSRCQSKGHGL